MRRHKETKEERESRKAKEMVNEMLANDRLNRRGLRIQVVSGEDVPDNTIFVGRPSKPWGGPFGYTQYGRERAVALYRDWIIRQKHDNKVKYNLDQLRGYDLACRCAVEIPCKADVLIELLYGIPEPVDEIWERRGTGTWWVGTEFRKCSGARMCEACKNGETPHGPYHYLRRRSWEGKQEAIYLGSSTEWVLTPSELDTINLTYGGDSAKPIREQIAFDLWGVVM